MKRAALFPLAFMAGVLCGWAAWMAAAAYAAWREFHN